jgi:hypothetical protein
MKRFIFSLLAACPFGWADVTVVEKDDRVVISDGRKLVTKFRFGDAPHVYYWPLIGPGGARMTRAYPMEKVAREETDHVHHRSLWFAHGDVNGVDFWGEAASNKGTPKHPVGKISHDGIAKAEGGKDSGVLVTKTKWEAPDGSVPVRGTQTLRVHSGAATERVLDFEITLTATEKDVVFGDTKEGTSALRIAESMRLKQPKGPGEGKIVNSEGSEGSKAWGQRAKWVTMSGPVDGKMYSITMMDHPSNLRHPTRWHARDYGLFAANPFCEAEMDKAKPKGSGAFTLKAGETLTLKYRIVLSEGDAAAAKAAERFTAWK